MLWKEVRDACTIDREEMERDERRNGGGRKWELGLEGLMGKEKKAKGKVVDGKGEDVEATPKRVKFEHVKPEKLAGSPKGSPRDTLPREAVHTRAISRVRGRARLQTPGLPIHARLQRTEESGSDRRS